MRGFEEQFHIYLAGAIPCPAGIPAEQATRLRRGMGGAVRSDLQQIHRTEVGKALLRSIGYHGVVVTIQPVLPGGCGSGTWPIETPSGINGANVVVTEGANINHSPANHSIGHNCESRYEGLGQVHFPSSHVLLHELVHAFRMVSFKLNTRAARGGFALYNTTEEIIAVLIQGIFASEIGAPVRSSHTGHFPMDPRLDSSFDFFKTGTEAFDHVKSFCDQNKGFTRMVAKVDTRFNPIRAYYQDPQKAASLSKGKFAEQRDQFQPLVKAIHSWLTTAMKKKP